MRSCRAASDAADHGPRRRSISASLPPLESITAESDIRAFLAPGVPPELTRAALRRAWAADPKIRDFVGLAEYDWDFNTPGAMAGFGPLEMTDELRASGRADGRPQPRRCGPGAGRAHPRRTSHESQAWLEPLMNRRYNDATPTAAGSKQ